MGGNLSHTNHLEGFCCMRAFCWKVLTAWLLCSAVGLAAEADLDFARDVKPLLARKCFSCHGPDKAEAGLRLHEFEAATAELDSGQYAIVPGKPEQSELLARVSSQDEFVRMPPEGEPLKAEEVEVLKRWIDSGAEWEKHWSFKPVTRPEVPPVERQDWVQNPIDAFILHRLEKNGLQPNPPADKIALIRRVYYDLTGLPPSPEEVQSFLKNNDPNAYEELVDRLLASPQYGERWARHWLDLVRYAETNSFERDGTKPNAWKYRDYVIRSFNEDKPYSQFVREQLAGDELDEVTKESLIATGYYRLGIWDDEPADPLQARYDELDGIITTTSQVFLGLTVNCARCHDHKIDPIPQTDYYKMLAFFHELTPYGTRGDQRSFSQTDVSPPELIAEYQRLDREERALQQEIRRIEQLGIVKMSAEDQRKTEGRERAKVLKAKLQEHLSKADWELYQEKQKALQSVQQHRRNLPARETVLSVAKCRPQPPETFVFQRGSPQAPGEKVEPGFPEIFEAPQPELPQSKREDHSSGRRRVLANWIVSPENRLTSRVIVNRIWQHHFGRGIVRSPNNFGQLGTPPTHPKLLDWLATEFVRQGWRFKKMHRLILTSNTYRMSSQANPEALKRDPSNELFWRFDMRRLSAEEVRDSVLAVNGSLNLKMFGPSFYPQISREVLQSQSRPGAGWGNSSPEERARRSIYIFVKRSLITPMLATFDFPETDVTCEARFTTTQPAQSLALINSEFIHRQAKRFAERLEAEAAEPREQVRRALWLTTCREPTEEEIARGVGLLERLQSEHELDARTALDYFCLVTLNQNEFLYLD